MLDKRVNPTNKKPGLFLLFRIKSQFSDNSSRFSNCVDIQNSNCLELRPNRCTKNMARNFSGFYINIGGFKIFEFSENVYRAGYFVGGIESIVFN